MFKLPGNLKVLSLILIVLGAIGIAYGFMTTPSNTEEVEEIVAAQQAKNNEIRLNDDQKIDELHQSGFAEKSRQYNDEVDFTKDQSKLDKALHQLKARPWAATFIGAFFFFMIALGALVFQAIQYVSEAGWSPLLFRVMEAIHKYVLPGSIIVAVIILLVGTYFYPWMNPDLVAQDEVLQGKSVYLNKPGFIVRLVIYLLIWNVYRHFMTKNSLAQNDMMDYTYTKKNYNISVIFLILFGLSESTMVWDWFMSMQPHWYSAMYAWYLFASLFVCGITVIAITTIYLKRKGHLDFINDSHIHDLAKYIFAFSIFWTYLWFSQFMLIWYANIPEEASYFVLRMQNYKLSFLLPLILNFVFPILILMSSDFKRIPWFTEFVGVVLLVGHYMSLYNMVVPSTVGLYGSFGIPEIAGLLFFLGLFILIVGTALGKVPLKPEGSPYMKESENFEY